MRILVTDGMSKSAIAQLRDNGHEVVEQFYAPEALGAALQEFDCVVVRSKTKIQASHMDEAVKGKLKLIIRGGVGVDNIDVTYAESKGIAVRNTPCASSASVAELALGHMFALARYIGISNATMRAGQWNKKAYEGTEISGKTLGLIGMGRIAQELAKRAQALGMQVVYTCRNGEKKELPQYTYLPLAELLKTSDYVSLHIPMPADRKPVLGEAELALMKPTAFLINTARGGVVAEDALLKALNEDKLAGAALDVFEDEPTGNEALCAHPKVSVTPHIGGQTAEAQSRIGDEIVSIINGF
ncbi:MAG: 3-phosphoglycerate dehydrogenase [Ruminococcaceae bacterium]|nr:3-phosphoglycerate dehydrogenase [Oscillospiraceae bacterium]